MRYQVFIKVIQKIKNLSTLAAEVPGLINSKFRKMKNILAGIALILLSSHSLIAQDKKVYANDFYVKVGDTAPDFKTRDSEGNDVKLSGFRGKVVMLQFTASWCSVCRTEMPFIEKEIWLKGKDLGLIVMGVDRDEPLEKVKGFKKSIGVSYPLILDPGADIFGLFAKKEGGVTRNVIIDRNGKIIFLTRLFDREEFDKMKSAIFEELKRK